MKITKEGKWYVAVDEKTNTATQGKTRKEAEKNLIEALSLYYESQPQPPLRPEFIKEMKEHEKTRKYVKIKNVKELFRKIAEEG